MGLIDDGTGSSTLVSGSRKDETRLTTYSTRMTENGTRLTILSTNDGLGKYYDNQLEVESFPKEKKPLPYEDKGENNDQLCITCKGI